VKATHNSLCCWFGWRMSCCFVWNKVL